MAENENVVEKEAVEAVEETAVAQEKTSEGFGAKCKEWLRKTTVKLKRQTQLIPLVLILITSMIYLCCIGTFSQVVFKNSGIEASGISMFINTLLSILILPIFLNAFPKRKKPNIVYIVAVFVVLAVLIGMDIMFYVNTQTYVEEKFINLDRNPMIPKAYTQLIVHMVFVGLSIVCFALLPVYKKLINKINTRKDIGENNLSEEIDTSAEV